MPRHLHQNGIVEAIVVRPTVRLTPFSPKNTECKDSEEQEWYSIKNN